ncbi:MAG: sigma 54-interacting transcriptional regulator, partial [Desulfosarcina sp.]|nr:sigma 54-interacting transcriptional regulator [Desulfosarcina sp.]
VSLLDGAAAHAQNIAHQLALEAADKILINDLVALQKMLDDQIVGDPTVAYLFVLSGDHLLAHTFNDGIPAHLIHANTIESTESASLEKIISESGSRFIDVAYPIFGGKAGTLRIGLSEAPYRSQVQQLWMQMSIITLGILVLALLVSHWMISRLTRPLQQLANYAEQIDAGNLDTQFTIKGRQEIAKLTSAFNSMLIRLQDYTRRLRESNHQLEVKNQALDRAHKQLETSFSISQEIAAFPKLDQICQFLIQTLEKAVVCRNLNLMVFNNAMRSITLTSRQQSLQLGQDLYDGIVDRFSGQEQLTFLRQPAIGQLNLPDSLSFGEQLALFPIRHHDLLIGAVVVACTGDCDCIRHELDVVSMILHQTAGAIHRANFYEEELRELKQRIDIETGFSGLVGRDPKMQVVFKLIEDVAPTDTTVLILGESGTGKELVARAIHERSHRAGKPFVVINCTAYPSTLLESELFGHEKGAFTGALRRKTGRFEQADGGTVFLDEIGEIDAVAQTKLLRVLQQQTIDRLGGSRSIRVDVRIIAATNKILSAEVKEGRFREDLFYRLNVIPLQLPPLRERPKDIHILAQHFLERFSKEQDKPVVGFRSEAMRKLIDNTWPGNVRELENSIEHAVVLAKDSLIELKDLPAAIVETTDSGSTDVSPPTLVKSEERLIREVLDACDWNKAGAARQLGISRSTLYEKLKRLQIVKPTFH